MAQWMKDLPYEHEGADLQHSLKSWALRHVIPHSAGVAETRGSLESAGQPA